MRKLLKSVFAFVAVCCVVLLVASVPARWQIRSILPVVPEWEALEAALDQRDGPISVAYINTASQQTSLGKLGHPAIVISWADGRRFLIDTGMPPDVARAFGQPMELLLGAGPTVVYGEVAEQLGDVVQSVKGIAFTHLHNDHTEGLPGICRVQSQPATVYQSTLQQQELNYTTEIGQAALDSATCPREALSDEVIKAVPGFPGLIAVSLAGHTPDSTMFALRIDGYTWIFSGDITNNLQSLLEDLPKPWWYSTLVVPENTSRTAQLRQWLKNLDVLPGVTVLPAHDVDAMAAAGLKEFQ